MPSHVDHVGSDVADASAPGNFLIQPPCQWRAWIEGELMQEASLELQHLSDSAFIDELLGECHGGPQPIHERYGIDASGFTNRLNHLFCRDRVIRQRFFAENMLAVLSGVDGNFCVCVVWCDDIDQVNVIFLGDVSPVVGSLLPAKVRGGFFSKLLGYVKQSDALDLRCPRIHHRDIAVCQTVSTSSKTGADQANSDLLLFHIAIFYRVYSVMRSWYSRDHMNSFSSKNVSGITKSLNL